jgi:hypothetical protein
MAYGKRGKTDSNAGQSNQILPYHRLIGMSILKNSSNQNLSKAIFISYGMLNPVFQGLCLSM